MYSVDDWTAFIPVWLHRYEWSFIASLSFKFSFKKIIDSTQFMVIFQPCLGLFPSKLCVLNLQSCELLHRYKSSLVAHIAVTYSVITSRLGALIGQQLTQRCNNYPSSITWFLSSLSMDVDWHWCVYNVYQTHFDGPHLNCEDIECPLHLHSGKGLPCRAKTFAGEVHQNQTVQQIPEKLTEANRAEWTIDKNNSTERDLWPTSGWDIVR